MVIFSNFKLIKMKHLNFLILLLFANGLNAQKTMYAIEDDGVTTLYLQDDYVSKTQIVAPQNAVLDVTTVLEDSTTITDTIVIQEARTLTEALQDKAVEWLAEAQDRERRLSAQLERHKAVVKRITGIERFIKNPKINVNAEKRKTPTDADAKKLKDLLEKGATEKKLSNAFTKTKLIKALMKLQENN